MSDLMKFEEAVARHNAAYAAFCEMYHSKTPPPQMPAVERTDWLTLIALVALVSASVIVSGSRTVVEFGGGLVGAAAFVMLELAIVAYGYIRTKKHYDEARHANVKRLTSAGMYLAFGVAVAANIHATLKQNGIAVWELVDVIILLLVAIAAPALAFIAGDVLGMEAVSARQRQSKAAARHAEAMQQWREGLNAAWHASPLYRNVRVVAVRDEALPSTTSNGTSIGTGMEAALPALSTLGHRKVRNATTLAEEFFQVHPGHIHTPCEQLVDQIGVGKSTINKVQQRLREGTRHESE